MAIGITEEHEELRQAVRRFVDTKIPPSAVRTAVDAKAESRPPFWGALCEPHWLGLHVDEANGGAGFGLVEQAVVLEELGRACAPGPYLATAIAAAVLEDAGGPAAARWLPNLTTGAATGAVALSGARPVLGGAQADVVVCELNGAWYALDAADVHASEVPSIDLVRRTAQLDLDAAQPSADQRLDGLTAERVRDLAAVLLASEAVGVAQWCVDTAAEYAKVRVQFGRPIGQFQGVKHRCADMLARVELARAAKTAAVWRSRPRPRSRSKPRS
jgi:alkylation response protein AidB-like acyl-CoA dehydrogenase